MERKIGKNTLGDNNKMKVTLKEYEMSTKDLSTVFRSSMAVGTLTPCLKIVAQKGDIFDIEMFNKTLTHATIGPLYGRFKLQHFIFSCPIRLYNSWLHNNKVGIGTKISQIKLPCVRINKNNGLNPLYNGAYEYRSSASSLMNYLGLKGVRTEVAFTGDIDIQMLPAIMYLDIFKNYFANTQEEDFYMISGKKAASIYIDYCNKFPYYVIESFQVGTDLKPLGVKMEANKIFEIPSSQRYTKEQRAQIWDSITISLSTTQNGTATKYNMKDIGVASENFTRWDTSKLGANNFYIQKIESTASWDVVVDLKNYKLSDIDKIKERILKCDGNKTFILNDNGDTETASNVNIIKDMIKAERPDQKETMEGLIVKTYDSDVFQNWVSNELIEGVQGINEASAVDVSDGKLSMDSLNLAQKVYNFLNRVAVAGNTYKDWLEMAYTSGKYMERPESPLFEGGMTQYIEFQEVVSKSATEEQPLGALAGRGVTTNPQTNGKLHFTVNEPSYIIGIAAITPQLDYSQGNDWDIAALKTMDDFHKPAFDGIGFEDSMNEYRAYWTAEYKNDGTKEDTAAGKTVAWVNYTTNFNRTFGSFASGGTEEHMVMNRNYERNGQNQISDLSTYIDPSKYNQIFADTSVNAQNFQVQTAFNIKVRRNIADKQIPNL